MKLIYIGSESREQFNEKIRKHNASVSIALWSVIALAIICGMVFKKLIFQFGSDMSPVVMVTTETSTGSAVYVHDNSGNDMLITACHVIEDIEVNDQIEVKFVNPNNNDEVIYTTATISYKGWTGNKQNTEDDYALLILDNPNINSIATPCPLGSSKDEKVGNKVYVEGYPNGVYSKTEGIINNVNGGVSENKDVFVVSAKAWPGNSGGALLNDKNSLIGIPTKVGAHFNIQDQTFCVKIDRILLELRKKGYDF